jgi:DNA gyrase subunit A
MDLGTVQRIDIEEKMRSAYLSYAMSVITARALPDVRDGLKPVQRRILYAMHDMGLRHDRPTRKSARIVGEVLGKYHPHGDTAVYEAMVRMAQEFSMRYPLIYGQGNFGSIDGDDAAAIRYTEARLSAIGGEMLQDLDKDAVDFADNFDSSLQEPTVLPAKLPNLLVNGVGGIAVGMATNIPPHNIGEIVDAIVYLIDRYAQVEDVTLDDLMRFVRGPDFPTGGTILGDEGIRQAYATGRGRVVMRSQIHREELSGGRLALIVSELPYQVNKSTLVGRIATLVREGRAEGIADLRDESDRTGIRIVIELKRGVDWESVVATLLKYSQLQATFGVNMLALVDGEPRTLSLKRALVHYIDHRHQVIERRTRYELNRALQRAHILEGLLIALDHLDEVIDTIRRSRTAETAKANLQKRFSFSDAQAQAILDMQLRRLAALERRRIQEEYRELMERIAYLQDLLADENKLRGLIKEDALEMKRAYGDPRRTRVSDLEVSTEISAGDLTPDEEVVVAVTVQGAVRQFPLEMLHAGPGGLLAALADAGEALVLLARANAQDKAVFITDQGRAFALGAHQLPDARLQPEGAPLTSLVRLEEGEALATLVVVSPSAEVGYLALATEQGRIKRLELAELASLGRDPSTVIGLSEGDRLAQAVRTSGEQELLLATTSGRAIRFPESEVRPQGSSAMGMRGIDLKGDDRLIGLAVVREGAELLVASANGFAKRSRLSEYSPQGRGGQGALTLDASKESIAGPLAAACVVAEGEHVILATRQGRMAHHPVGDLPRTARASWGRVVTRTRSGAAIELPEGDAVIACLALGESGPQAAEGAGPQGAAPPQEAAPRKAAPRKAAPKPRATRGKTATTAAQATLPEPAGEAPKPTRRSRTKPQAPDPEAEAKPTTAKAAPGRRASRAKPQTPEPPKPEAEAKAISRRRRTTKAPPQTEADAPAEDKSADQGPAPRTRRAPTRRAPQRKQPEE